MIFQYFTPVHLWCQSSMISAVVSGIVIDTRLFKLVRHYVQISMDKMVRPGHNHSARTFGRLMKRLALPRQKAVDFTKRTRGVLKASIKLVQQRWTRSDRLKHSTTPMHIYEIRPRADHHGVDLISDVLPYSPLWYRGPNAIRDAIGCAKHRSRSHDAVIRVYNAAGNVIETREHKSKFKDW
jgi:hypothetical protein